MEEELSMCRAHLQIMGFRKHACFELKTEGIEGTEKIPPAIFHTLIENGLTHGYAERDQGLFILSSINLLQVSGTLSLMMGIAHQI